MTKTLLAAAALASAFATVPAFASPTAAVKTADLNLSSVAGREALARRISFAAKRVCTVDGDKSLIAFIDGTKCYNQAVASANRQVASASDGVVVASR